MKTKITYNIGLDLVRATEAAALAAGRWMGMGKPDEADQATTKALLETLNAVDIDGCIAVGIEKTQNLYQLLVGNKIGSGEGPSIDIVLDAVD